MITDTQSTTPIIPQADRDKFFRNIEVVDGHWLWTASTNQDGYGRLTVHGQAWRAHRYAWMLFAGPIPDGGVIRHDAGCPRNCCNPCHLTIGTQAQNIMDQIVADGHYNAKLTEDEVRAIRASSKTNRELAAAFGVSDTLISRVRSGIRYRHVV